MSIHSGGTPKVAASNLRARVRIAVDVNKVSAQFLQFHWIYFLYAVLLSMLNFLFRFIKRHYCLNRGGAGNFTFSNSFHLFLASFPLSVTPMKVGESFKGIWLNRLSGIPVEKAVSIFLVDTSIKKKPFICHSLPCNKHSIMVMKYTFSG